jgi:hypothetical protein
MDRMPNRRPFGIMPITRRGGFGITSSTHIPEPSIRLADPSIFKGYLAQHDGEWSGTIYAERPA